MSEQLAPNTRLATTLAAMDVAGEVDIRKANIYFIRHLTLQRRKHTLLA